MDDPKVKVTLPEVTIKAKAINPKGYKAVTEQVKLTPSGRVDQSKIDSATKAVYGFKKAIGDPYKKDFQAPQYGEAASDVIKNFIK